VHHLSARTRTVFLESVGWRTEQESVIPDGRQSVRRSQQSCLWNTPWLRSARTISGAQTVQITPIILN